MKWNLVRIVLALSMLSVVAPAFAGEWKFAVGVTYASGFDDVLDYHEDALGVDSDFSFPIGAAFHSYLELDKGHRIGLDAGPMGLIFIDTNFGDDKTYFNLPIGATYGYAFARDGSVAPYVRAGVRYNVASGDFVDSSSPGLIGAIGLEMARQKRVHFGIEAAFDNATIDLVDDSGIFPLLAPKEVEAGGFQLAFRVIF